ncbi:MAG: efflux RND transporter permease subunit [Pseudomonadota bacterium]
MADQNGPAPLLPRRFPAVPTDGLGGAIRLFTRHPNAANLVMALMVLAGLYGLANLNTQFFPDIEQKSITINVVWSGASAEDVESNILEVIEPEVRFITGVDEVTSSGREGSGSVTLEFTDDTDMIEARADVEQALAGISLLPEGSDNPTLTTSAFSDRVGSVAISGPFSEEALKSYARDLRDQLIDAGVDSVDFNGLRDTEFEISINAATLRRLDFTVGDIAQRISENSRDLPSGNLDGTLERQIRTLSAAERVDDLGRIVVRGEATGERIELRDIADLRQTNDSSQAQGFVSGERAIQLDVFRASTDDVLDVANALTNTVQLAAAEYPQSLSMEIYNLSSTAVEQRIGILVSNGLTGLIVVVTILFVFLNLRIAFWVAVGIPTALMATLGLLYVFGGSINMISLLALIMTLGIIVDDAIVVGEHTATRLSMGDEPYAAAENGARRMMLPVIAAMLTTAAAFAPILLIGSTIGQIMMALPIVVICVLIASLLEVFFVLPAHLAHSLGAPARKGLSWTRLILTALLLAAPMVLVLYQPAIVDAVGLGDIARAIQAHPIAETPALPTLLAVMAFALALGLELLRLRGEGKANRMTAAERLSHKGVLRTGFDRGFEWFRDQPFRAVVKTAVSWRYVTVAFAVATLIGISGVVRGNHVGFVFFPSPEAESISASINFTPGVSEADALAVLEQVDAALFAADAQITAELPNEDTVIRSTYSTYGSSGRNRGDNFASIDVELTTSEERSIRTPDVVRAWRRALPDLPGVDRVAIFERRGGPPGRDLDIRLLGNDADTLKAASADLQELLSGLPGVSGVDDDLPYGKPEIVMTLTERGEALGFTLDDVGRQTRDAVGGRTARSLAFPDEEVDIVVRQSMGEGGASALRALELRSPAGVYVPLTEVVHLQDRQGFSVILRRDGRTSVSVTADVNPEVITNTEIEASLRDGELQRIAGTYGVEFEFSGRAEERADAFGDLQVGGIIALGVMYIVLAWVFASYWRPIVVMTIIPFGVVGAILGHWLMGFQLTILSMIGLLGLAGILVNNSIILVSRFEDRLKEGLDVAAAAVQATQDRFRAILLTSLTTVGGLSPLLFETSQQAQFLLPIIITITFGLASATLFVLVLVPALLKVGDDIGIILKGLFGRKLADEPIPDAPSIVPAE